MPFVIALSALLCPPLAMLLCGERRQAALSLVLFIATYSLQFWVTPSLPYGAIAISIPGLVNVVWAFTVVRGYDKRRAQQKVEVSAQED